jgi:hypothetical protein
LNTAVKQILSYPAFLKYSTNAKYIGMLVNNLSFHRWGGNYKWAMENLPGFKERISSGNMGDEKLLLETGSLIDKFLRAGMLPNRWVDAFSVMAGSRAVYEYGLEKYRKAGMSEEEAQNRAKMDAYIVYNSTNQSARAEFLAAVQKKKGLFSRGGTTFQNATFGNMRNFAAAVTDITRDSAPIIERLTKDKIASGMEETAAREAAKKEVYGAKIRGAKDALLFGFFMEATFALFEKYAYNAWGDDDDDDKWKDIARAVLVSPIKGLLYVGQVVDNRTQGYKWNPILFAAELNNAIDDVMKAAKESGVISLEMAQAVVLNSLRVGGINYETFENMYKAIELAVKNGDWDTVNTLYLINAPNSTRERNAENIRKGESIKDYIDRVADAYKNEKKFERNRSRILKKYRQEVSQTNNNTFGWEGTKISGWE